VARKWSHDPIEALTTNLRDIGEGTGERRCTHRRLDSQTIDAGLSPVSDPQYGLSIDRPLAGYFFRKLIAPLNDETVIKALPLP
jgi:hypothetical protein